MKYCPNCGSSNEDQAMFCANCGQAMEEPAAEEVVVEEAIVEEAPVYEAPAFEEEAPAAPVADNGKNPATLWMILNIVITVLTCCGCGLNILGIIGIVFGVMGMNAYKSGDVATGDSKTKVAKIMFFVALAMGILSVIISMSTYGLSLFVALMEEFS